MDVDNETSSGDQSVVTIDSACSTVNISSDSVLVCSSGGDTHHSQAGDVNDTQEHSTGQLSVQEISTGSLFSSPEITDITTVSEINTNISAEKLTSENNAKDNADGLFSSPASSNPEIDAGVSNMSTDGSCNNVFNQDEVPSRTVGDSSIKSSVRDNLCSITVDESSQKSSGSGHFTNSSKDSSGNPALNEPISIISESKSPHSIGVNIRNEDRVKRVDTAQEPEPKRMKIGGNGDVDELTLLNRRKAEILGQDFQSLLEKNTDIVEKGDADTNTVNVENTAGKEQITTANKDDIVNAVTFEPRSSTASESGGLVDVSMGSSVVEGEQVQPSVWDNDFTKLPKYLCEGKADYVSDKENFLKGVKWAPDGTCFMTNSEDNCLRLFNVPQQICNLQLDDIPEMYSALQIHEGELIYDYCWYPKMNPADPASCCVLSTSRDAPVHMWDAFTGQLISTYKPHDHLDELISAHSLAVSPDGNTLYCGFNKLIKVFNINRPGKLCKNRPTLVDPGMHKGGKRKKSKSAKVGQSGIISCIAVNPAQPTMYAAGSYTRSIGLYCEPEGTMYCMFQGQAGGVTHLKFSPDGNRLYSGGRKDPEIICWDVRNPGKILHVLRRNVSTNQRVYFDFDHSGQYVLSGGQDGQVLVWDTLAPPCEDGEEGEPLIAPCASYACHRDCVNGVSLHPTMPVIATASGQRHFSGPSIYDSDSESENCVTKTNRESTVKLWWIGKTV